MLRNNPFGLFISKNITHRSDFDNIAFKHQYIKDCKSVLI
jgi:hypothetical protein